jgi:outer membrane biogenesis lipoprotein LolB
MLKSTPHTPLCQEAIETPCRLSGNGRLSMMLCVCTFMLAACMPARSPLPVTSITPLSASRAAKEAGIGELAPSQAIPDFRLSGRLSIRHQDQNHVIRINWQHTAAGDEIDFASPWGPTLARLSTQGNQARLETANGEIIEAESLNALTEHLLGVGLPVSALTAWVSGQLPQEEYAGWLIESVGDSQPKAAATEQAASPTPLSRPSLIRFKKADIEGKLKIDEWQPLP